MAVLHAYIDATNLKTLAVQPIIGYMKASVFDSYRYATRYSVAGVVNRFRMVTAVRSQMPIDNAMGQKWLTPLRNRGSIFLSTFPPVYKTALGAEAGKAKTPRTFPAIYIKTGR